MTYVLDARTATDHFPGIGRYVSNLANALVPLLAPGEKLALPHDPAVASQWTLPLAGERVTLLPAGSSPFGIAQQFQVPRLIKNAAMYHSPYYLQPYFPGIPAVLTVYDLIPILFGSAVPARTRLLYGLTNRLAIRASRHLIAISESTRQDYIAHFKLDPGDITTIPLAPAEHMKPQPPGVQAAIRQKYGLPERFMLYVGINKPHKNLVRLVQAMDRIAGDLPLAIGGAWDPRYPQARETADRLGLGDRVRFLGPLPDADLPALFSACSLFVFPSLYEGFGLPVIEAMACGAPVACSNSSSLPEAGGSAAAYFDPASKTEIAEQLSELLAAPGRLDGMSARSLAQAAGFSWRRTAQATVEIYRSFAYNDVAGEQLR